MGWKVWGLIPVGAYSSRLALEPTYSPYNGYWGSFVGVVLIATVSFILPSVCLEFLCFWWADFLEI